MRVMHSFSREDPTRGREGLTPGTTRRVAEFARPYSRQLLSFLVLVVVDAVLVVATPLLFKKIVDQGVLKGDRRLVTILAIIIAALAVGEAALTLGAWAAGWQPVLGYVVACGLTASAGVWLVRRRLSTLVLDTFQSQPFGVA